MTTTADAHAEVRALARVSLVAGRLTWASAPPLVVRRTGPRRVHVVAVGGGPLGGDELGLRVEVGEGEHLAVHSAAATVVQPGRVPGVPARHDLAATVGAGGALDWRPEPTVVCDRAFWSPSLQLDLADGASARVVEQIVLGRSGQAGGACRSAVRVSVDGRCVLANTTVLDGADPALRGPGGTGGSRSAGSALLLGPGGPGSGDREGDEVAGAPEERSGAERSTLWARTPLAGPGSWLTAVGTTREVAAVLAREGSQTFP